MMDMSKSVQFRINPQYISRDFQGKISEFYDNKKNVLILDAPTGAGKTHSFNLLENIEGVHFLVLPNNLLIEEKFVEFSRLIGEKRVLRLSKKYIDDYMKEHNHQPKNYNYFLNDLDDMLYNKKLIITNPALLFLIIFNFYWKKVRKRGSQMSDLILNGLKSIIFDEIHVYSIDQLNRILSINLSLYKKIKFIYSSATIPNFILDPLMEYLGQDAIEYVKVLTEKNGVKIRGPINVTVTDENILNLINDIIKKENQEKWFIIANKIKTISEIQNCLLENGFNKEDIKTISGYHDPELKKLKQLFEKNPKIVIGSNIIEQGFNPPKEYKNFIIEAGMYDYNFIQRFGRIGRGMEEDSKVFISINKNITEDIKSEEYDKFLGNFSDLLRRKDYNIKNSVPYYIAVFLYFLDKDSREILLNQLDKKLRGKINYVLININKIDNFIKNLKINNKKLKPSDINGFSDWWNYYLNTFTKFISTGESIKIVDIFESTTMDFLFETEYNKLWTILNKKIEGKDENGNWIVSDFRDKKFKDFTVKVIGLPWHEKQFSYSVVENNERKLLKESVDESSPDYDYRKLLSEKDQELNEIANFIKDFITNTAWPERLSINPIGEDIFES